MIKTDTFTTSELVPFSLRLGAEAYIMDSFSFQDYRIKIITAERLSGPIAEYLKANGYEYVTELSLFGESLWILSSIRNELNWSAFKGLYSKIENKTGIKIDYKYKPR